jgi:hypothetical protein
MISDLTTTMYSLKNVAILDSFPDDCQLFYDFFTKTNSELYIIGRGSAFLERVNSALELFSYKSKV